ncbi:hypothetical protein [Leeia oryzae]|uniref:hypothetical protein n=1 Tax=Leeia oryzae TaxID=356662 RepID=UPI00037A349C|nr:hypothetical protein [Leeia oryzae]
MHLHRKWLGNFIYFTAGILLSTCLAHAQAASLPVDKNTLENTLTLLSEGVEWTDYSKIQSIQFQTKAPKTTSDDGVSRQIGHFRMRDGHTLANLSIEGNKTNPAEIKLDIPLRGKTRYPKIVDVIQSNLPSSTMMVIADQCESYSIEEDAPLFIEVSLPASRKIYVNAYTDRASTAHGDFSVQYYAFTKYKPVEQIKNAHCKKLR